MTARAGEHTPGPWLLSGDLVYALDETATANRFSARIEGGYEINYRRHPVRTHDAELQANARLIAAAPDLLEALVEMERAFGAECSGGPAVRARAAIAKARGNP